MSIEVTIRHLDTDEGLKAYAEARAGKLMQEFTDCNSCNSMPEKPEKREITIECRLVKVENRKSL